MAAPTPDDEDARLRALAAHGIGEPGHIPALDRVAAHAAELFDVPVALVSVVTAEEQVFNGACGLGLPGTPRDVAFCAYTILQDDVLLVPDAREDPRFADNPLVTGPLGIRFYAGAPLILAGGEHVGSLCLIDTHPRTLDEAGRRRLAALARIAVDVIGLRRGSLAARASEQRAREAQAHLLDAIEAIPAPVAIYDADDRLVQVNTRFREAFPPAGSREVELGVTFEEVLRRYAAQGLSMAVDGSGEDWLARRLAVRRSGKGSCELRLPDGRWFRSYERRGPSGILVSVAVDVSDLKQREAEIARQSALLRATIESIDQGLAVFDPRGRLVVSNERFFALLGIPRRLAEEGTPVRSVARGLAAQGGMTLPDRLREVAAFCRGARTRLGLVTRDGRAFEVARGPMPDGGFVVTYADVTERHRLDRMRDEFVSTVSHELRTPLTSIAGALRLLAGGVAGPLPAQGTALVEIAQKNAERLARLIEDLLEVGRLQAGQAQLNLVPVELGELVRQSVAQNRPFADGQGVDLRLAEPPSAVLVPGDPDRLLQVVANLLSNAIKFSPQGEAVDVSTEVRDGMGRIAVRDRGPGVPEEFHARMFQRFAQADASDRRRHGGTGLGLSIVREIVLAHGGRVGFEPAPGGGTVFHVDLPLAGVPAEA